MTPTPQKLTPEMIEAQVEAAAQLHWFVADRDSIENWRAFYRVNHYMRADMLAAASKHTGADDLAEALEDIMRTTDGIMIRPKAYDLAHAALAKHRALMGRV